jgi:heme ABC exporter ATP-binding subunit CcmA
MDEQRMGKSRIAIEAKGLTRLLGGKTVLSGLDLRIALGETVALMGINGAGKTTLLRCLAGSLRPSGGEVRWFDTPAGNHPSSRRLIGAAGHETHLYPHLNIRENLIFAARMHGLDGPRRRADELLDQVGLTIHALRTPGRLSKGMRQRVAIARALIHDPPILLFDEPFAGLDGQGTEWLLDSLRGHPRRPRAICLATHDSEKAKQVAGRVIRLHSGKICELDSEERESLASAEGPSRARAA